MGFRHLKAGHKAAERHQQERQAAHGQSNVGSSQLEPECDPADDDEHCAWDVNLLAVEARQPLQVELEPQTRVIGWKVIELEKLWLRCDGRTLTRRQSNHWRSFTMFNKFEVAQAKSVGDANGRVEHFPLQRDVLGRVSIC